MFDTPETHTWHESKLLNKAQRPGYIAETFTCIPALTCVIKVILLEWHTRQEYMTISSAGRAEASNYSKKVLQCPGNRVWASCPHLREHK